MQACIITNRQQWNDFVASSECCNITQSYEWGELSSHLGASDVLRVGVVDSTGCLLAAMLLLVSTLPVLKCTYFYAPRGPIVADPDSPALTVLLNFVKAEAYRYRAVMLKVEPSVADENRHWSHTLKMRGFRPNPYATHIRHEWVLDIRPDEQTLLAAMKEKWRYNIRLATRKGVTVRQGEGAADLETFYRLYQTTSKRDLFVIHEKSLYTDIMNHFGTDGRAALFLAEYAGQAIASTIVLTLGHWSWYMYGASSNEERERMPNHLLQWTSIQWAKAHGCWYYNFRGIPDILEEGQELWGIYLFKRGFGGYPIRFMQTHDLVYQPLLYETYRRMLDLKRWRDQRRYMRTATQERHP
jgi:lipid II:glycine glycyltransferase (peptidoglycan interpeptide bridge formation enzyme)